MPLTGKKFSLHRIGGGSGGFAELEALAALLLLLTVFACAHSQYRSITALWRHLCKAEEQSRTLDTALRLLPGLLRGRDRKAHTLKFSPIDAQARCTPGPNVNGKYALYRCKMRAAAPFGVCSAKESETEYRTQEVLVWAELAD